LRQHDRYLLCCDGVHAALEETRLFGLLAERAAPEEAARRVVDTALEAGSRDNATALVVDVVAVPAAERIDLEILMATLPLRDLPSPGDNVDGFRLQEIISDGRYSRLFRADDQHEPRSVILKFPHPRVATDAACRRAFVREAWVAAQVRSPYVGEVIDLAPGRQTRLYSAMPYYPGETLEQRLCRVPPVSLDQGIEIGTRLAKAVYSLNRRNIIHRDIKPENVILEEGASGLKLLDLGVARLPALEGDADEDIPGTPSYMAPELFEGHRGNERSDVYALGVTLYRVLSGGRYPYGEVEAFSRPRFGRRTPVTRYRPDIPAWMDALLARATAVDPGERYGDAMELAFELENGQLHGARVVARRVPLYERNPLRFWQGISFMLFIVLIVVLVVG
jgi:serine/threonine protein kinase